MFEDSDVNVLTLLLLIGSSRAAAVTGLQPMVLSVQITVQTSVDVQMSVTAQKYRGYIQVPLNNFI